VQENQVAFVVVIALVQVFLQLARLVQHLFRQNGSAVLQTNIAKRTIVRFFQMFLQHDQRPEILLIFFAVLNRALHGFHFSANIFHFIVLEVDPILGVKSKDTLSNSKFSVQTRSQASGLTLHMTTSSSSC
jgi:hypothetical protein